MTSGRRAAFGRVPPAAWGWLCAHTLSKPPSRQHRGGAGASVLGANAGRALETRGSSAGEVESSPLHRTDGALTKSSQSAVEGDAESLLSFQSPRKLCISSPASFFFFFFF